MRQAMLWLLIAPLAAVAIVVLVALGSATLRERRVRASRHPVGLFIDAGDTRLFVQRQGDPLAPAVVFIAGTAGWSGLWHASMARAVSLGFQAIAIDLPPFGYSYPAPSGNYSKQDQGRRLLAVLDALHLDKVTIVAHSIGAAPVMEALFSRPSLIRSLVLVDPALGLDGPQTDGADTDVQAALRHVWVVRPISAILTNPLLTAALLRRVISEKDRATPEWVSLYQQPLMLRGASAAIGQWLPEVLGTRGRQRSDDRAAYAALRLPVTLIWGATDTITPLPQGVHLQQLIPGAQLRVIPRAGHGPQFEEPELFDAALAAGLRDGS